MVEQTQRNFFEEEKENYGENVTLYDGKEKSAARMGVQVSLEDGEPKVYHFMSVTGSFSREQ